MRLNLSRKELILIKLYVLNQDDSDIKAFLNISNNTLGQIKNELKSKFYTHCIIDVILFCVEHKYIKKIDLLEDSTKFFCLEYVIENPIENFNNLEDYIIRFYIELTEHNRNIYLNKSAEEKLSLEEIAFLRYKYNGLEIKGLKNVSDLTYSEYLSYKNKIFSKLKKSNFFNVLKISYSFGLLPRDINAELELIKRYLNHNNKLRKLKSKKYSFDKALLYNEILKIFSHIEYNILWGAKPLKQIEQHINNKTLITT